VIRCVCLLVGWFVCSLVNIFIRSFVLSQCVLFLPGRDMSLVITFLLCPL